MLRKATQDDLPALVALRCKAARTNRTDAAGWLQNVAGLENILLLVKSGAPPAAMLAAVPVEYGQHHGVWLCGLAGEQGVPLDRLLVETDCPYMTPVPFRGKRNEPAYVRYVAEKLAEVRGIPTEEIIRITEENAKRFFGLA